MKIITKIMVAVDFSDYSLAAAEYAARLAKDTGAALLFVNVFNQRDVNMMKKAALRIPEFAVDKYLEENMTFRQESLDNLADKTKAGGLAVETSLRVGVPYEALLQEIAEKKPDLLVMGAKGRSNLVDMILGSCAQKMFRRSPIPLLSVRGK